MYDLDQEQLDFMLEKYIHIYALNRHEKDSELYINLYPLVTCPELVCW